MKGIIDIHIKRKDGTIEHREEHNVVFDLPAMAQKYLATTPVRTLLGSVALPELLSNIGSFALSEDLSDLTKPAYRPYALSTQLSASSNWWISAATRIVEDKTVKIQGTWTVQEAMTLKSIFIRGNSTPTIQAPSRIFSFVDEYGVYQENFVSRNCSKKLNFSDYNNNNRYFGRLVADSEVKYSDVLYLVPDTAVVYYHYPLANPNERYRIVDANGVPRGYYWDSYQITPACELQIINPETNAIVRKFLLSQFTGFVNSTGGRECMVIHSETKNWLIQPYSSTICRIWQIPDAPTENSIAPLSEEFSPNLYQRLQCVVGSYFTRGSSTGTSYYSRGGTHSVYRITDDGTAVGYKGQSGSDREGNSTDSYVSPRAHMFDGFYEQPSMGSMSGMTTPTGSVKFTNLTASNFTTPITLAEGDVLTISYTIEVI